ncbi:MAG: tetratricopeptide repeat protein [Treponema sp.]|jgi:putative GTP pyrophosphokinase|nr:tetratricopeptide repeat protein [Treponema sp.]
MNKVSLPDQRTLRQIYEQYAENRTLVIKDLEIRIEKTVSVLPSRPTAKGRAKDFDSFFKKYIRLLKNSPPNSGPPLITDLIGIRIVCPFIEDLAGVEELIKKNFEVMEVERKGSQYSFKEFGYESTHLLIKIPRDILESRGKTDCEAAEIQIRTILQNAWAEVEHELVYKAEFTPFDDPMKRKLAAVNASLSLADIIFQEIRTYQRQLNGELGKRRETFFQKIEESTDGLLFSEGGIPGEDPEKMERSAEAPVFSHESIDDLLLNALYAHNKNQFNEAIAFYSRILELKPDQTVSSLIYKHRGMANFARSQYQDAIDDFTRALELDPASYKAVYYRGVVRTVLKEYSGAIDDFTLSLSINPYQPFCLFRRGQAYYHIEDYPQALGDCETSLALEPGSEVVRRFKKLLLEKLRM